MESAGNSVVYVSLVMSDGVVQVRGVYPFPRPAWPSASAHGVAGLPVSVDWFNTLNGRVVRCSSPSLASVHDLGSGYPAPSLSGSILPAREVAQVSVSRPWVADMDSGVKR